MILKNSISDKDIERSLWFIRNKNKIKKIIIITLIIIIAALYSFFIFKLINVLIQKDDFTFETIDFRAYQEKNRPKDLIVGEKEIINRGGGKYDFAITISNPNERIGAYYFKYQLLLNDDPLEVERYDFIMPGQESKIIELNIDSKTSIRKLDIDIQEIKWKRISQDELKKFENDIFEITDKEVYINTKDDSTRNLARFKVKNISPYNFKNSKFYAILYLGSKIVAINEVEVDRFKSEEIKNLQSSWYYPISSYAALEVLSKVNLLDQDNYFVE